MHRNKENIDKDSRTLSISMVGDVMPGGELYRDIEKYEEISLKTVHDLIKADISFCNLECALFKEGVPPNKNKILLHAKPRSIDFIENAGFNVVSLANNHMMDFGYESVLKTKRLLDERGILYTGAGKNIDEASKPVIVEKNGIKVAFLAYTTWTKDKGKHCAKGAGINSAGVAPFDINLIKQKVNELKKISDFIVVSVHWSNNDVIYPHPSVIKMGRKIIEMGANIVVGHHPHVLQGFEEYNGGLIFYSLGNFFFPEYYRLEVNFGKQIDYNKKGELRKWLPENRESIIVRIYLYMNGSFKYDIVPVVQKETEPILEIPSLRKKNIILDKINDLSKIYCKKTYILIYNSKIFKDHLKSFSRSIKRDGIISTIKKSLVLITNQ